MIVYHSSNCIVTTPDLEHSRPFLDFGKGFYITSNKEQALKYGERFKLRGNDAYLNEYSYDIDDKTFNIKVFESYNEEWLDFVSLCRKGLDQSNWDIVIGGVANDKVFRTIDLYFSGDISKEDALKKLIYEKPNNQICIRSAKALSDVLTYIGSTKL